MNGSQEKFWANKSMLNFSRQTHTRRVPESHGLFQNWATFRNKISIKYSLLQNLNQISLHLIINTRHREASDYQIRLFLDDFPNGLFSIEIDQVKFSTQNNLENEIEDISLRGAYMFKDDRGQQLKYLTIPPSPLFTSLCLLAFPFAAPMTPCSSLRVYSLFSIPALIALSMIVIRKDSCEKNSCHPYVPNR